MNMIDKAKIKNKNKIVNSYSKKADEKEQPFNVIIKTPNTNLNNFNLNPKNFIKFEPGINLCKIIEKDNSKFRRIVSQFETFNKILANYLLKPKINIKAVELKIKNDTFKIEKEISEMKKNLEDKIDSVLEKANSCLDNIKQMSKKKSQSLSSSKNLKINNKFEEKTKSQENSNISKNSQTNENNQNLKSIVKNLSEKYNDEIKVNEDNLNFYFTLIAKNRKNLKELKEKNKNMKLKIKNSKILFCEIYKNSYGNNESNKKNLSISTLQREENLNTISNSIFRSDFYKDLNSDFFSFSIVDSLLFDKLYINVLYNMDQSGNENFLFDVFSLWFLLKKIKNFQFLDSKSSSSYIPLIKTKSDFIKYKKDSNDLDKFVNEICVDKLNRYLDIIFQYSKNKNISENNFSLNEENIFGREFFQIFENLMKILKLKYMKIVGHDIQNLNKNMTNKILPKNRSKVALNEQQKEELMYLKSTYSIIMNNCGYSYEICKKE